jgi:glycosyltransferase involved in cell wall biosynthesis
MERLSSADLFVLPSVDEPYPMTILESLSAGVPVLCTTSCGLAGAIKDSDAGVVVGTSQAELERGLRSVLNDRDRLATLSQHARTTAAEVFSIQAVADELEQLYASAMQRANKSRSLLWVTNLATPYRLPLWRELAKETKLTVALLADTEPNRHWDLDLGSEAFMVRRLHAPVIRSTDALTLYGPSLTLMQLVAARPGAMVIDGWESPAYIAAALWAKLNRVPVVASYRSTDKSHRYSRGPIAGFRRRLFRSMDGVLTGGTASSDAVRAMGVLDDRISQGFNTVDVDAFAEARPAERVITLPAGDSHHYLYVGQLIPRKNVPSLLRAFSEIANPSDTLMIVGTGPDEQELRALAEHLRIEGQVTFAGHLDGDALVEAYSANDTLVLPSTEEVWGLVANEALAAGLHAVISDACGAAPSMEGMPGVYIASPTTAGLASAMTISRAEWRGPIADHPIRQHTPQALATIVLSAAQRALANKKPWNPSGSAPLWS